MALVAALTIAARARLAVGLVRPGGRRSPRAMAAAAALVLVLAGCNSVSSPSPSPALDNPSSSPAAVAASPTSTPSPIPLEVPALALVLPWDTSVTPSHVIPCAYNGEGITGGSVGPTAGCAHHVNGPSGTVSPGYTQDGDALDLDLESGAVVRSVESGIVRWAQAYSGPKSWSCYGQSVAIDTRLADGTVVTAFYAHLSAIAVSPGQQVSQGKAIGQAGNTGGGTNAVCPATYGPHLHFALYANANYLDASGRALQAAALSEDPVAAPAAPVSSPPYGGTAILPQPWLDCQRASTLTSPPVGETSACVGLHAGDRLTSAPGAVAVTAPPPPVLAGTWVSPKAGATVKTLKLKLSAKPTASLPDVTLTKVVYSIAWGSKAPKTACTASKAAADGTWSCSADLVKLGAPLGKLTLSFDVFDDAGDVALAPDGTRTVKFASPPPVPTSVSYKQDAGYPSVRASVTWSEPDGYATAVEVYALTTCFAPATSSGIPCISLGTPLSSSVLMLIESARPASGSVSWTEPGGESGGELGYFRNQPYWGVLVVAVNQYGRSRFIIAATAESCYQCTY